MDINAQGNATQMIKITNHLVSIPAKNYCQIVIIPAQESAMKHAMKDAFRRLSVSFFVDTDSKLSAI